MIREEVDDENREDDYPDVEVEDAEIPDNDLGGYQDEFQAFNSVPAGGDYIQGAVSRPGSFIDGPNPRSQAGSFIDAP